MVGATPFTVPISFKSINILGQSSIIKALPNGTIYIEPNQLVVFQNQGLFFPSAFPGSIVASEAAQQFSDFSKENNEVIVMNTLAEIFPEIGAINIELSDGVGILHCAVPGSSKNYKRPILNVSTGIGKLLTILLGIATFENGIAMIDEIDNGIYYQKLEKMWESIYKFADKFKVQVFVSTHSKECLQNLSNVIKGHEEDFRLVRMDNEGEVSVFAGEDLEAALKSKYDVR